MRFGAIDESPSLVAGPIECFLSYDPEKFVEAGDLSAGRRPLGNSEPIQNRRSARALEPIVGLSDKS